MVENWLKFEVFSKLRTKFEKTYGNFWQIIRELNLRYTRRYTRILKFKMIQFSKFRIIIG